MKHCGQCRYLVNYCWHCFRVDTVEGRVAHHSLSTAAWSLPTSIISDLHVAPPPRVATDSWPRREVTAASAAGPSGYWVMRRDICRARHLSSTAGTMTFSDCLPTILPPSSFSSPSSLAGVPVTSKIKSRCFHISRDVTVTGASPPADDDLLLELAWLILMISFSRDVKPGAIKAQRELWWWL